MKKHLIRIHHVQFGEGGLTIHCDGWSTKTTDGLWEAWFHNPDPIDGEIIERVMLPISRLYRITDHQPLPVE